MDVLDAVVGGLFGLLVGVVGDRSVWRREVRAERREQRRQAAEAILPGLRTLRDLAREAAVSPDPHRWSKAVVDTFAAIDSVANRLPDRWLHLGHSVRAATGEVAGAVTFSDLDPAAREVPLPAYNRQWAMYAEEYLDYTIYRLQTWRDLPQLSRARAPELLNFDTWLYDTGRVDRVPLGWRRRRRRP